MKSKTNQLITVLTLGAIVSGNVLICSSCSQQEKPEVNTHEYLENALKTIRTKALRTDKVDWRTVNPHCEELCKDAKTTVDTYPAINYALSKLNGYRNMLLNAEDKQRAVAVVESQVKRNQINTPNILFDKNMSVGFISFDKSASKLTPAAQKKYVADRWSAIESVARKKPRGWIVDMRGAGANDMWLELATVGPILGSGVCGHFHNLESDDPWFYKDGTVGRSNKEKTEVKFAMDRKAPNIAKQFPVAVLIDSSTQRDNELVAISFEQRPDTKFFGDQTNGTAPLNETFELPDGAVLSLMTSSACDKIHKPYEKGIVPDVLVQSGDTIGGTRDKVIQAAMDWLITKHVPNSHGWLNPWKQ